MLIIPYQKTQKLFVRFIRTILPIMAICVCFNTSPPFTAKSYASPVMGKPFTIKCKKYRKTCGIHVVDGDSFIFDRVHYRLIGVDTPEISKARCGKEEMVGRHAKETVFQRLQNAKYVTITPAITINMIAFWPILILITNPLARGWLTINWR